MDQSDVNIVTFEQILMFIRISIVELEQIKNRAIWLAVFVEFDIL